MSPQFFFFFFFFWRYQPRYNNHFKSIFTREYCLFEDVGFKCGLDKQTFTLCAVINTIDSELYTLLVQNKKKKLITKIRKLKAYQDNRHNKVDIFSNVYLHCIDIECLQCYVQS